MKFKEYNIYKSNFWLFTLNRIVEVIVYIFVWKAIFAQTGNAGGFTVEQIITYYILVTTIKPFALWGINEDIAHSIRNGNISKELLNSMTYFQYCFGVNLGEMAFAFVVGLASFIVCSILWGITLQFNLLNFILAVIIILVGIIISFFMQMIVGTVGFYSSSIWGMQILKKAIISIFSGIIAPLTLFPEWFQKIANILPFKELIYTPVNVLMGNIELNQIWIIIVKQILWVFITYGIAKIFFNHSIKKVTINGG